MTTEVLFNYEPCPKVNTKKLYLTTLLLTVLSLHFSHGDTRAKQAPMANTKNSTSLLIANQSQNTKFVIAIGIGKDVTSALQNAAQQALINTVGSFIDSETKINSFRSFEGDTIESEKLIIKNLEEFSQGSILSIDLIKHEKQGELTKVTARVQIKIDTLKALIKKPKNNAKDLNQGIFSSITINQRNARSRSNIVLKRIIDPVRFGKPLEISIGKALTAEAFVDSSKCRKHLQEPHSVRHKTINWWEIRGVCMAAEKEPINTFIIPIKVSINSIFREEMRKVLERVSRDKADLRFGDRSLASKIGKLEKRFDYRHAQGDYILTIFDRDKSRATAYHLPRFFNSLSPEDGRNLYNTWRTHAGNNYTIHFKGNDNKSRSYTFAYHEDISSDELAYIKVFPVDRSLVGATGDNKGIGSYKRSVYGNPKASILISESNFLLMIRAHPALIRFTQSISISFHEPE